MDELKMLIGFCVALIISLVSIPSIVTVAKAKGLCETPDRRRLHKGVIPTLGGIAIYAAMFIPIFLIPNTQQDQEYIRYLAAACTILFFIGIKDDILLIAPTTKLIGQIVAALTLCMLGNIRITDFHSILGITQIPEWASIVVSTCIIVGCINAFNLIDGVDGLSALLGITGTIMFAYWFYLEKHYSLCVSAASFCGAIVGFLRYNLFSKKNKIFMGDTGSQIVGLFCGFLAIEFCELNLIAYPDNKVVYAPAIAFAILCIPLFDVIRIMFIRKVINKPLFQPDNNHIHFRMLKLGLTHKQIDFILIVANIIYATIVYWLSTTTTSYRLLIIMLLLLMFIFHIPQAIQNYRNGKTDNKNK